MTKLGTMDHHGEQLVIFFKDSLHDSPALPLILETYSELLKAGFANFSIPFRNNSKVVWLENNKGIVFGGICFDYFQERREGWIYLSFTDKKYRGQGINQICHNYFEQICKDLGATSIGSTVFINNINRLKSAKKVGLEPVSYKMYKSI